MNFSFDSVKLKSKLQNEDFYFDIETPRGHLFAILDFESHDYANLNATLRGKLETIVGSFASLSNFSNELFLGFLAKEINNFVNNLAEQSGGPELLFSAGLCLVSGNRLFYFLCGDVKISILGKDGVSPLPAAASADQLGVRNQEAPMADQIQDFTLQDADVVLMMTQSVAEVFESRRLSSKVMKSHESEPKLICELLMKGSVAGREDRTLVVIGGPFAPHLDASLPDLSLLADFKTSLASLEARLDALTEREQSKKSDDGRLEGSEATQLEQTLGRQIETLRDDLRSKAAAIDVLELDEKLKGLSASLAGKADTADVLGLQRDVLKLGLATDPLRPSKANETTEATPLSLARGVTNEAAGNAAISPASLESRAGVRRSGSDTARVSRQPALSPTSFTVKAALIVVAISLAAGFVGGWLQSRATKKSAEVWSVKTSGNQIAISRLDGPDGQDVTLTMAEPVKSTGEQTFSSFADVKQYIHTVTNSTAPPAQTNQSNQSTASTDSKAFEIVSEITIKQGDSMKKLSEAYNVTPEKLMELNPTITRWRSLRTGQKVVVPAAGSTTAASLPAQVDQTPANQSPANTTEATIGRGDTLSQLARRFNTTPERLKELNPQITNWQRLQIGQKVVVPTTAAG